MRVLVACKRGNIAKRNRHGHCLCVDCVAFRNRRSNETKRLGYLAEWQRKNPERCREYSARWIADNKEKRKMIVKSWRTRHPEKVSEMSNRAGAKWSKNNKGKRNAITAARRAAIRKRCPLWADRNAIAAVYVEAARISKETGVPHEVDHIYPLQGKLVSGLHVHNNLRIIKKTDNRSKGNSLCVS